MSDMTDGKPIWYCWHHGFNRYVPAPAGMTTSSTGTDWPPPGIVDHETAMNWNDHFGIKESPR